MTQGPAEGRVNLDLKGNLENPDDLEDQGYLGLAALRAFQVIQAHKEILEVPGHWARRVQTELQDSLDLRDWMDSTASEALKAQREPAAKTSPDRLDREVSPEPKGLEATRVLLDPSTLEPKARWEHQGTQVFQVTPVSLVTLRKAVRDSYQEIMEILDMKDQQELQVLLEHRGLRGAAFLPKEIRGELAPRGYRAKRDIQALEGLLDLPVPSSLQDPKVRKVSTVEWAFRDPKVHKVHPDPAAGKATKAQLEIGVSKELLVNSSPEV